MHPLTDLAYLPLNEWQDRARDLISNALAERYQRVMELAQVLGRFGWGGQLATALV